MRITDLTSYQSTSAGAISPTRSQPQGSGAIIGAGYNPPARQDQRASVLGLDITAKNKRLSPTILDPLAVGLTLGSTFPYQVDSLPLVIDDNNQVVSQIDFNTLIASLKQVQAVCQNILRYGPGDLTAETSGGLRLLDGYSSGAVMPRRPCSLTVGTTIIVSGSGSVSTASSIITLTSQQKNALGLGTVEGQAGISFITGCKLHSLSSPAASYDPASLCAKCAIRFDSAGTLQMYLVPSLSVASSGTNSSYSLSAGSPYVAPGTWYAWVMIFLSPYTWPNYPSYLKTT